MPQPDTGTQVIPQPDTGTGILPQPDTGGSMAPGATGTDLPAAPADSGASNEVPPPVENGGSSDAAPGSGGAPPGGGGVQPGTDQQQPLNNLLQNLIQPSP